MDIPNAFIQSHIEDEKYMAIINNRRVLVYIMLEIAPDVYGTYVITKRNGVKQPIVKFHNTIYSKINKRLLYFKMFRKSIEDEGYEFNPYEPCVAKNIIKVSHMTVCFHVDYCNLIHKRPKLLGKTIIWIKQEYESIFEDGSGSITFQQCKVHNYLGMALN